MRASFASTRFSARDYPCERATRSAKPWTSVPISRTRGSDGTNAGRRSKNSPTPTSRRAADTMRRTRLPWPIPGSFRDGWVESRCPVRQSSRTVLRFRSRQVRTRRPGFDGHRVGGNVDGDVARPSLLDVSLLGASIDNPDGFDDPPQGCVRRGCRFRGTGQPVAQRIPEGRDNQLQYFNLTHLRTGPRSDPHADPADRTYQCLQPSPVRPAQLKPVLADFRTDHEHRELRSDYAVLPSIEFLACCDRQVVLLSDLMTTVYLPEKRPRVRRFGCQCSLAGPLLFGLLHVCDGVPESGQPPEQYLMAPPIDERGQHQTALHHRQREGCQMTGPFRTVAFDGQSSFEQVGPTRALEHVFWRASDDAAVSKTTVAIGQPSLPPDGLACCQAGS